MLKSFIYICLLIIVFVSSVQAQDVFLKHYGTTEGLPSNMIFKAYQDSDGYIWFGTNRGASCFDGFNFQNYSVKDGLAANAVFHFDEDDEKRIYMVTFLGRVSYLENGIIKETQGAKEIQEQQGNSIVSSIVAFSPDSFYLGFRQKGYIKVFKDTIINEIDTVRNFFINEFENGKLLYGTTGIAKCPMTLLKYRNKNTFISLDAQNEGKIHPRALRVNKNEIIYSAGNKVLLFKNNKEVSCLREFDEHIINLSRDRQGNVWVGTLKGGAYFFPNGDLTIENPERLLKGYSVDVLQDREGNYWLSTLENGVYFLQSKSLLCFSEFSTKEKGHIEHFWNFDGELWMLNNRNKVFSLDKKGNIKQAKDYDSKLNLRVMGMLRSTKGIEYHCGSYKDDPMFFKMLVFDGAKVKQMSLVSAFKDMLESKIDSTIFVTTHIGLHELKDDSLMAIKGSEAFRCNQLREDKKGNLFIINRDGVWRLSLKNRLLRKFKPDKMHFDGSILNVSDLIVLDDDMLCLGTLGRGLYIYDQKSETSRCFNLETTGFKTGYIHAIFVDKNGDIWFGANGGLFVLRKYMNAASFDDYKLARVLNVDFGEIYDINIVDNKLYLASGQGLFVLDDLALEDNQKPDLVITKMLVNQRLRSIDQQLIFNHDENNIEINFQVFSYRNLDEYEYLYKLKGVDKDWNQIKSNVVRFSQLSPGKYIFQLKVLGQNDLVEFVFRIKKPFWKKWWFITIVTLLAILFGWWLVDTRYRSLLRTVRMREKLLEAEDSVLKAQINPHFLFNSLSTLNSFIYKEDKEKAIRYLEGLSDLLRYVLSSKDSRLVRLADELKIVKEYCYLQKARFGDKLNFNLSVSEVDAERLYIVPMAFHMLIENAVKHNYATTTRKLYIRVSVKGNYLIVSNNLQLRQNIFSSKIGLKNIRKRYHMVTKRPVIIDNDGTNFVVKIPLFGEVDKGK
ncbi:hypothetical protein EMN47_04360 [Prolixibacteraceae bacterium JC049]|nr:hypothetical protein [Prolixibacteraceae bacterium JC049]